MQVLNTQQLATMMDRNAKGFLLVNVLDAPQFRKHHIPDSINIPLSDEDFLRRVGEHTGSKSDPIVVYCASQECTASPKAAEKLEAAGFTNVFDYSTGMEGWVQENRPIAAV